MNIIRAIFKSFFIYTLFVFLIGCVLTFAFTIDHIKHNFNVIDGNFIRIEHPKVKDQKWHVNHELT